MAVSALVVVVPEAEALVRPFRDRHDPAAAVGVPAHVTLLYPFVRPDAIDASVRDGVGQCFARFAPFRFALAAIRRFPGVLYLAPEPDEPFRRLTLAIWERFPDTPPYGGKHPAIVPHLTVAQLADAPRLDAVAAEFAQAAQRRLPLQATASAVALMDNRSGLWRVRDTIGLGG